MYRGMQTRIIQPTGTYMYCQLRDSGDANLYPLEQEPI